MKLFETKQFKIDFELYNRSVFYNDEEDPQNQLTFEFEGQKLILRELSLRNEKSEQGPDFYWVELHSFSLENEEVRLEDFIWNLNAYYEGQNVQETTSDQMFYKDLPYDSEIPIMLLKLARDKWPEIEDWAIRTYERCTGETFPPAL